MDILFEELKKEQKKYNKLKSKISHQKANISLVIEKIKNEICVKYPKVFF